MNYCIYKAFACVPKNGNKKNYSLGDVDMRLLVICFRYVYRKILEL